MGCASSTPMIASGSEMLKAATHTTEEVAKSAEGAIKDMTQTLVKTIDTGKETVETTATEIARDLGNAFTERTNAAKSNLLETLHLNGENDATSNANKRNATGQLQKQHGQNGKDKDKGDVVDGLGDGNVGGNGDGDDDSIDADITQRLSRVPTPTVAGATSSTADATQQDADSLKTSTPEPEIEQALANYGEDSPPTPKPNISELERLSVELRESQTDVIADIAHVAHNTAHASAQISEKATTELMIQPRPGTTEWEKHADTLLQNQKFHPNEIALRRRLLGGHGSLSKILITGPKSTLPSRTLPTTLTNIATTATKMSFPTMTTAAAATTTGVATILPTTFNSNELLNGIIAPTIDSPQHSETKNLISNDESGHSDRNYGVSSNSNSNSSPSHQLHTGTRVLRKRIPRNANTINAKKIHRQLTSLIGLSREKSLSSYGLNSLNLPHGFGHSPWNRNFDFNPNRIRIGSPPSFARRRNLQILPPFRLDDSTTRNRRSHSLSHTRTRVPFIVGSKSRSIPIPMSIQPLPTSSSSTSHIGLNFIERNNSPILKTLPRAHSLSRSTTSSSTNNSITKKFNGPRTVSRSATKSSSTYRDIVTTMDELPVEQHGINFRSHSPSPTPSRTRSRSSLPVILRSEVKNTSSFLSSPRTSPFETRKSYVEYDENENKAVFNAELSSFNEHRCLRTPSPYKIRDRCVVCYNKYFVK